MKKKYMIYILVLGFLVIAGVSAWSLKRNKPSLDALQDRWEIDFKGKVSVKNVYQGDIDPRGKGARLYLVNDKKNFFEDYHFIDKASEGDLATANISFKEIVNRNKLKLNADEIVNKESKMRIFKGNKSWLYIIKTTKKDKYYLLEILGG